MAFQVDSEAILETVFPPNVRRLIPVYDPGGEFETDITSGQLHEYLNQAQCAQAGRPADTGTNIARIGSQATGLAASGLAAILPAVAAIPIVGQIIAGVGAIFAGIGKIFSGHAQAVAREQGTLCSVVPEVNSALLAVDQDFAAGNIDYQQASIELDQIQAQFDAAVAPIRQDSPGKCNAACVIDRVVQAEVIARKQTYTGHTPLIYYFKHYWWAFAIGIVALFLMAHRVRIEGA